MKKRSFPILASLAVGISVLGGAVSLSIETVALAGQQQSVREHLAEVEHWLTISGKYESPCDEKQASIRRELVEAVDAKMASMPAVFSGATDLYKQVKLGPATFLERVSSVDTAPGPHEDFFSWDLAYKEYLDAKAAPSDRKWIKLLDDVRFLLDLDENRAHYLPGFYPSADADYDAVISDLKKCLADPACDAFPKTDSCARLIPTDKFYMGYARDIATRSNTADRRGYIRMALDDLVRFQKEYLAFVPERTVRRVSPSEIVVPIDPGPFASAKDYLSGIIEQVWSSPNLKVNVEWVDHAANPGAYQIGFLSDSGARAFVQREQRQITLTDEMVIRGFAHEFGHVLGFRDDYYDLWDETRCGFMDRYDSRDIMADSSFGSVTADEWVVLNHAYPYQAR